METPIIFKHGAYNISDLAKFRKTHPVWRTRDILLTQLEELFEIRHPGLKTNQATSQKQRQFVKKALGKSHETAGNWIYFPWNGLFLHTVGEKDYDSLRTNRNQDLITKREQNLLANFIPAVAGLSIGNAMATNLVYQGIGRQIKIADFDRLSTSNLNRLKAGLGDIDTPKILLTQRQLWEANPYLNIHAYDRGLTDKNLAEFVTGKPKPRIIFEAIDNFQMKIKLRLAARKAKIPVVMLTNLGDRILVDIERYDLTPRLPLFNGVIGKIPELILKKPLTPADTQRYAVSLVGQKNVPPRALQSLKKIHRTLVGRPQLMTTVTVSGGLAAYIARQICLNRLRRSGRLLIDLEKLI